ncbi:MAG: hypothetical protein K2W92_05000 [Alphaproteobacteria bacterium]|nr:hypothetical protein [Alphaproteobacteria bacterium]
MYTDSEELDYSGPSMLTRRGQRVTDIQASPRATTVDGLLQELEEEEDLSGVTKFNLSKNNITDRSIEKIVNFSLKNLSSLKALDLSFNKFSEESTSVFAPLLLQEYFEYLNIVGTGGAASTDGIKSLVSALESMIPDFGELERSKKVSSCIFKVIWIPKLWLESENTRRYVSTSQIEAHNNYYKKYK